MYIVRCPNGDRWKVREARSLKDALDEIAHAKATGSIGSSSTFTTYADNGGSGLIVVANVIQINSDGTERQPYTGVY